MKNKEHITVPLTVHEPSEIKAQRYSIKMLSEMYDVSIPTFKKWLKPYQDRIGQRLGHFYNTHQIEIIFEIFGLPDQVINNKRAA